MFSFLENMCLFCFVNYLFGQFKFCSKMGIDKFYRNVGIGLRRVFQIFVKKPIRNFNIENRSFKAIEKPKVAPWHESTQKVIKELKKGLFFFFWFH